MKSFGIDFSHKQTNKQIRLLKKLFLNRFTNAIFVLKKTYRYETGSIKIPVYKLKFSYVFFNVQKQYSTPKCNTTL